ncbi:MAG: hypothetical protein JXR88_14485 [Clostridia bacterium]|nr:hypothetical protein [Clostridia bacterium]
MQGLDIGVVLSIVGVIVGIVGLLMVSKHFVNNINQKNKHGNNTISNTTIGNEIKKNDK